MNRNPCLIHIEMKVNIRVAGIVEKTIKNFNSDFTNIKVTRRARTLRWWLELAIFLINVNPFRGIDYPETLLHDLYDGI